MKYQIFFLLKSKFLTLALLFSLFLSVFQFNFLYLSPSLWFQDFEKGSEGLVVAAMVHSRNDASANEGCVAMTGGGAMLKREYWSCNGPIKIGMGGFGYAVADWPTNVYTAFSKGEQINNPKYTYYSSAVGLQGHLFATLYKLTGINEVFYYQLVNSFLLALIFSVFVFIVHQEIGIMPAFTFTLMTITSPWLVVAARNLYWAPWTWFLPALTVMLTVRNQKFKIVGLVMYGAAVLIKLLCGYEYASAVLLTSFIPILYIFLRDSWRPIKFLIELIAYSISALVGIIAAFTLHSYARADSIKTGFTLIVNDAHRRMEGVSGVSETLESINASRYTILRKYLNAPDGMPLSTLFPFSFKIFLCLLFLISVYLYRKSDKKGKSLAVVFFFSLLPPISWFFLAKQHSFLHTHLVYVLWSLPTFGISSLCLGYFLADFAEHFKKWKRINHE